MKKNEKDILAGQYSMSNVYIVRFVVGEMGDEPGETGKEPSPGHSRPR